jgi:conjugative relaxase-like TrwC/TraI family protein
MFQSQTAEQAKAYFDKALSKADYYINDQELNGRFHGKLAERLGVRGELVEREIFHALCDNLHPTTGENLTPRTVNNRRVGYDISFHCPKSVSILHALGNDTRILDAFTNSVQSTMQEMEADMQTRVRVHGANHNRDTGELIWADFVHQTARPVKGFAPDPHLHCHCFTFNASWDKTEHRIKAGQFHNIKRDMPWYQARFQKRLADNIAQLGYGIRKTDKAFEVTVIPKNAIAHFSKRTNEIGQIAKELGITDPKELDELGARTRGNKESSLSMGELKAVWREQLEREEIDEDFKGEHPSTLTTNDPQKSIDHAIDHAFARKSVERERRILAEGYLHAIDNHAITIDQLDKTFQSDERIFKVQDGQETLCTTLLVQAEEKRMVRLAQSMRSNVMPLVYLDDDLKLTDLNNEQQVAVKHVLKSNDQLVMVQGGAGTGKTTMMKTVVEHIESMDKHVYAFAPTADASRDMLRSEGFKNADTVASLLKNERYETRIKNQVIWLDEAGMLSTKDMADILSLAKDNNAKVILTGDTRQHTAVERGDAMRILRQVAGVPIPSVNRIYRQKSKPYREVVEAISEGRITKGFEQLDKMGAIIAFPSNPDHNTLDQSNTLSDKDTTNENQDTPQFLHYVKSDKDNETEKESSAVTLESQLAQDYAEAVKENRTALVISPTNEQARLVTDQIRNRLKEAGQLDQKERSFTRLKNLYLTDAQKQDVRSYEKGMVIQLHQNMKGVKKGARLTVESHNNETVIVHHKEQSFELDKSRAKDFGVYRPMELKLAKGDMIRITKNGFDLNKKRLDNGKTLEVVGFGVGGSIIKLQAPANKRGQRQGLMYEISKQHGNLNHAYCITSYASQGKTYDRVFIAQPSMTFAASDKKQFYVSVSRGREAVKIYTDDKEELLETINQDGDRMSVHELEDRASLKTQFKVQSKTITPNINRDDYEPDI